MALKPMGWWCIVMNKAVQKLENWNSEPVSDAGVKVRHSLAAVALRSSAAPITLAIIITTLLAYALFFASIKQQQLDELALFSKQRVNYELEIFRLAEDNLATLKADTIEQFQQISLEESDRYIQNTTELLADGTRRTRAEDFDTHSETQIFIAKNVELSAQAKRALTVTDKLVAKYGLAWRNRFPNLYFIGTENYSTVLWYEESFILGLPADFTHMDKPYYLVGTPKYNPSGENRWTSIYLDDTSHKLMVSSIMPLYIDNQFVGNFGHDIYLDELMARTIGNHPDGAINMLITNTGELISHPQYMGLIAESGNAIAIDQSGDENLKTIYRVIRKQQAEQPIANTAQNKIATVVVEDKAFDRYLVATQMGEMGWIMITEYPRSLISREAFYLARTVLVLGAILLVVEFIVLFMVVRRKVSGPLEQLGLAAHSWKLKRTQAFFADFANRKDEVGSLSREFMRLQETIDEQFAQLHKEIEERTRAEEALQKQTDELSHLNANLDSMVKRRTVDLEREVHERSLLTAAMEHAVESIMIANEKLEIEYVNAMFEQQSGYSKEEVLGKTPMELNRFHSDLSAQQEILAAVNVGKMWSGRVHTQTKDGTKLEEDVSISPIRDGQGKVTHFIEVKRNITERVALEQQLQSAQKLESIGQLAAGIAHEINTPIQYIGDNTKFLKEAHGDVSKLIEKLEALSPGEVSKEQINQLLETADISYLQKEIPLAIEQCLEGVARVAKIVRAMKEFSHPSKEKAPSDLNKAIESTITVAANEWKYVAQVETCFDESLPLVNCELGEINQVVLNIIVNAAHAIGDAKKGEEKGVISVSTAYQHGFAEIRIADNGAGMPASVKAKIFDPFFTTKEVGKGTGQGLSIAHKVIVKNHGGSINVESTLGKGTEFIIRLPVNTQAGDDAEDDQQSAPAGLF